MADVTESVELKGVAMNESQLKAKIREHMPILSSEDEELGLVDRLEGDEIKLTKDESGQHHYIPADWVESIDDDEVHVGRTGREVMKDWTTTPRF
jgi:hypothetical protein